MAGSIYLSSNVSWSGSTVTFTLIAKLTRDRFPAEQASTLEAAYLPLEQACDFLTLEEFDSDSFCRFYSYSKQSLEEFRSDSDRKLYFGEFHEEVCKSWASLLQLMEADIRFNIDVNR